MTVRKGATRVEVHDDGLGVFLCDEANRARLTEMKAAAVVSGTLEANTGEERLAQLAREGLLVAYELFQGDSICLEVAVGLASS